MKKEELIACVLDAHRTLVGEADLSPRNPRVNDALSTLVRGIMQGCAPADAEEVLADPAVCAVRGKLLEKLAIAEGELEKHWARMLCARASLTVSDFREFVYWGCYCHLVAGEFHNLPPGLNIRKGQSIAFVGAGPLPLSAIILHVRTGMRVTCIDLDPHACALARDLCRKAGLAAIDVTCADGARCGYHHHPVVFVASLVREKSNVVECIREECPHAIVALRSAEGLCTLLYDPVDEKELEAMGCRVLGRTAYDPQAINTTLFCRAASALRGAGAGPARRPAAAPSEGLPVAVSSG
jgi:nicotianamine synthase-like protein